MNTKYSTKNNKTEGNEIFLKIKNQKRAITSSAMNFTPIAIRTWKTLLCGPLVWPLAKISIDNKATAKKASDKIPVS